MRRTRRALSAALTCGLLAYGLSACSAGDAGDDGDGRTLRVLAAASLAEPFAEIADRFADEQAAAGEQVEVQLSVAGSADLVAQVDAGAPADLLATADTATMDQVDDELLADEPRVFATNTLTLVVPPDNPAAITDLDDATASGVRLVVCAPAVPCGAAATKVAEAAGVTLRPVSEEQSVTDVLGKVRSGEADAGLVYVTDLAGAGDAVRGIDVPEAAQVVNAYPVAPLGGDEEGLAAAFVDFVLGPTGQEVLAEAGFGRP